MLHLFIFAGLQELQKRNNFMHSLGMPQYNGLQGKFFSIVAITFTNKIPISQKSAILSEFFVFFFLDLFNQSNDYNRYSQLLQQQQQPPQQKHPQHPQQQKFGKKK